MKTIDALEKHACPACGAQAEWDPGKQLLRCPYCGTDSPFSIDSGTGQIREIDLVQTLREMGDEARGWQAPKSTVRCQSCNAVSVFDQGRVGQNCEFCGSPSLVPYEELKAPIRPQTLLPFKVSQSEVRDRVRDWFRSRWLAPGKLKSRALVDQIKGLYVPYWTFDAQVRCPWTAESGYYYYTTESYRDAQGRMQTRQKQHVRWQPSSGQIDHVFDDELIPGSQGIRPDLLRRVEPFHTQELVPYDTAYLSGFIVEHYKVVLVQAAQQARESMDVQLRGMAASQVPGDTHRNLQIFPQYSGQTFKHILVPVWLLSYDFGARKYQVVVNGHSGTIAGDYPKSFWKIALIVLAILMVVLVFVMMGNL